MTGNHSNVPANGAASVACGQKVCQAKNTRQVEDHADHGGGDAGQRRGEFEFVARGFDKRPAREDEPGTTAGR